jgi:hypothetical protein
MLHQAPRNQLNRLRKAELVRLWKVAGIWEGDTESVESESMADEQEDYRKSQLIEGILEAVSGSLSCADIQFGDFDLFLYKNSATLRLHIIRANRS